MEINILQQEKNKLKFEVIGEDHTLCNLLRKELWEDSNTEVAGYSLEHPVVSNPIFVVESKKDPQKTILNSINSLNKKIADLKKEAGKL